MSRRFDRVACLTWGFVGLGVLVRLVRYLVVYPIWHDEAFLAVNFLDRGYPDLLRPLDYSQVSPILFLWVELTAVRLLGFSEWSLRLFPAICGILGVFLFRSLAARLLRGMALLFAVGIFAAAFYPIRHSAEVKPYSSDLLSALVILALAVNWWRSPAQSRWWWILCGVVPVLLALSYPAVFVAAAVSLALGQKALQHPAARVRLGYLVFNLIAAASFIGLYFACTFTQATALRSYYRFGYWRDSFPPWQHPWRLPAWLIGVHTGTTMAYPIGGERGASILTLIAVLTGVFVLCRGRRAVIARLLLAPCAVGLATALLGRYPYGGAPRITQYLVPSICLLAGLGGAFLVARLPSPWLRRSGSRSSLVISSIPTGSRAMK
jgi:Dolichyl-phosphate-mannose-protein mannosyltransferase